MKILITGGLGFIGFNVAVEAIERGHDVTIMDVKSPHDEKWKLAESLGIKSRRQNILELVHGREAPFDFIIHCAGQTAVTHSLKNPRHDFVTNAHGTFEVLEYARKVGARVLYTSTNKVYGENVNKVSIDELESRYRHSGNFAIDELFPIDQTKHSPYGCSKLTGDLYVQEYRHLYGMENIVFRMSCIYGGAQQGTEDQGWISHMVKRWMGGKNINVYGDGKQVRDILHIDDLVEAMFRAMDNPVGGVYNIGGGFESNISILELIHMLKELEPNSHTELLYHPWREADQKVYISNTTKARKRFTFDVTIFPKEGIARLVEYERRAIK